MKINEAVDKINELETVCAKHTNGCLFVFEIGGDADQFVDFLDNQEQLSVSDFNIRTCTSASLEDMSKVFHILQELVNTPLAQRKPGKQYYLRWMNDFNGTRNEIVRDSGGKWHLVNPPFTHIYSESELDELKCQEPRLATAIDAMKEPVEERNNDE